MIGDAAATAEALLAAVPRAPGPARSRAGGAGRVAAGAGATSPTRRRTAAWTRATLSIALDDLLPAERTVVVDSGHFMGWPSMYLRVPDAPASSSRRPSSASDSAWATRSAPRSRARTG